jgi:chromosome segregation ATPase
LNAALSTAHAQHAHLESERATLQGEMASLQAVVSAARSHAHVVQDRAIAMTIAAFSELSLREQQERSRSTDRAEQERAMVASHEHALKQCDQAGRDLEVLQEAQLAKVLAELAGTKADLSCRQAELAGVESELANTRGSAAGIAQEKDAIAVQLELVEGELQARRTRYSQTEADLRSAEQQVATLSAAQETAHASSTEQATALQSQLASSAVSLGSSMQEAANLAERLASTERANMGHLTTIQDLADAATHTLAAHAAAGQHLRASLGEERERGAALEGSLAAVRRQALAQAGQLAADTTSLVEAVARELGCGLATERQLQAQLGEVRAQACTAREGLDAQMASVHTEKQALLARVESELAATIQTARDIHTAAQTALAR